MLIISGYGWRVRSQPKNNLLGDMGIVPKFQPV